MTDITNQIINGEKQLTVYKKTMKNLIFDDLVKNFKDDLNWSKFVEYYNQDKKFCIIEKENIKRNEQYLFYYWFKYLVTYDDINLNNINETPLIEIDEGFDSILISEVDDTVYTKIDSLILNIDQENSLLIIS